MGVVARTAGRAMRRAVEVAALPALFEVFQLPADVPNGRYRNEKAKRVRGWTPRDRREERCRRLPPRTPRPGLPPLPGAGTAASHQPGSGTSTIE
jgi:hypothetical protein